MTYETIITQYEDRAILITINRENKLNALNAATLRELNHAITAALDNVDVRGIILTGAGEKAFVAGADILEFSNFDQIRGRQLAQHGQDTVFDLIQYASKPIVAAINGFALGGGLELALACHIRVASRTAKLGLPEVSLGLIPGYGGTQRLTQLVGRGRALELILTADMITAEQAEGMGLVNHVVDPDELLDKAKGVVARIGSRSPRAVAAAITAVNASLDPTKDGFGVEIEEFGKCFGTDDFREGVDAFLNKRKPNF